VIAPASHGVDAPSPVVISRETVASFADPIGVLVTGATTPLGSALCAALLGRRKIRHIIAVGRQPAGEVALPDSDRLEYEQVDLTRPRRAQELLFGPARDCGVQVLIDLSMHRSPLTEGKEAHALNVESLRSLIDLAERHPTIRRIVLRSYAEVYRVDQDLPNLVTEDCPLDLAPNRPQWLRDRVEADLTACTRVGTSPLGIAVLRCSEILAPGTGSLLYSWLDGPACLRPLGFDPMINVLSIPDAVDALMRATRAREANGIFNIAGADTLPLSECVRRWRRQGIPLPGPIIPALFGIRRLFGRGELSYGMNWQRFHYASIVDGTRAAERLGYTPRHPLEWPSPEE
jgi:UDP-glucose 4-epimerase